MESETAVIQAIYRYPVKGLSPQALQRIRLTAGQTIPADRLYAIENGPTGFDPAAPAYLPKQRFLMLMRNERLAALRTDFDEATHTLTVRWQGAEAARGDLRTLQGRKTIEDFFARFCADELRGPPKVLQGEDHSFSDVARKVVSIINLASVAAVEDAVGLPSIRCASGPTFMCLAGRPGASSTFSIKQSPSESPRAQGSSSG